MSHGELLSITSDEGFLCLNTADSGPPWSGGRRGSMLEAIDLYPEHTQGSLPILHLRAVVGNYEKVRCAFLSLTEWEVGHKNSFCSKQ